MASLHNECEIFSFLFQVYNLGTGKGYSVFDMLKALEKASLKKVCF